MAVVPCSSLSLGAGRCEQRRMMGLKTKWARGPTGSYLDSTGGLQSMSTLLPSPTFLDVYSSIRLPTAH